MPDPADQHTDPDGFLARATLLAELGRYDEAAAEVGFAVALDPSNVEALLLLARVRLRARQLPEALAAAEAALGVAGPAHVDALAVRGLALVKLERYGEAADDAERILNLAPDDPKAQRFGAGLLSESRNGQRALDAAWRAVHLAPDDADAHLVLGVVAARLRLCQLAEQAYREALRLDPRVAEAHHELGVLGLERRRYAEALEHLAEAAALDPRRPSRARAVGAALHDLLAYVAGYAMLASLLLACSAAGNRAISRVEAVLFAVLGVGILTFLATRLPQRTGGVRGLWPLVRADRGLAVGVYAAAAVPILILLYALTGSPWTLAWAVAAGAITFIARLIPPT